MSTDVIKFRYIFLFNIIVFFRPLVLYIISTINCFSMLFWGSEFVNTKAACPIGGILDIVICSFPKKC